MGPGLEGGVGSHGGAGAFVCLGRAHCLFFPHVTSVPSHVPPLTCASSRAHLVCCREPSSPLCWPPGTSPVGGGARVPGTSCTGLLDAMTLLGSWVPPETAEDTTVQALLTHHNRHRERKEEVKSQQTEAWLEVQSGFPAHSSTGVLRPGH